jgi:peptidoglycan/xylan/chitin deacetylase (PgdA/CDA1 family)
MFSTDQLKGLSLPEKTLCLTFDDGPGETEGDGPGPKTVRLAEYLTEQNIFATFFMVGKFAIQYPHILPAVSKLGHIVGNHTFSHPRLPEFFQAGGDIIAEIKRTDELILRWTLNNTVYFRAPYGLWSPDVANVLNQIRDDGVSYFGPFNWDINGADFSFWDAGKSAEECSNQYLNEIERTKRGIVLMHDSTADIDQMRINNRTFETIKILIPKLKSLGYIFVRLDTIII